MNRKIVFLITFIVEYAFKFRSISARSRIKIGLENFSQSTRVCVTMFSGVSSIFSFYIIISKSLTNTSTILGFVLVGTLFLLFISGLSSYSD